MSNTSLDYGDLFVNITNHPSQNIDAGIKREVDKTGSEFLEVQLGYVSRSLIRSFKH